MHALLTQEGRPPSKGGLIVSECNGASELGGSVSILFSMCPFDLGGLQDSLLSFDTSGLFGYCRKRTFAVPTQSRLKEVVTTDGHPEEKPSNETIRLERAPIIEAVLDLECDFEPTSKLDSIEQAARDAFRATYPKLRKQVTQTHKLQSKPDAEPVVSATQQLTAYVFHSSDDLQLVQLRAGGFSFNRLAPYTTLDDYLLEIERSWSIYREVARPIQIRRIGLRFINRILLPLDNHRLHFNDYLNGLGELPEEDERFNYIGFLNQHNAIEKSTGNHLKVILTTQPVEGDFVPVILDVDTRFPCSIEPTNWNEAREHIESLRNLKNHIFRNMLTNRCLNLFRSV